MSPLLRGELSAEAVFRENEPLHNKVTLRLGGAARYYAEPATLDDLKWLLREAQRLEVAPFFLGRGSNLLVLDGVLPYLVIRLRHPNWRKLTLLDEMQLQAGAGVRLRELCGQASKLGLSGFEFLEGIPGTLGGGLRMNAGAMGGSMYQVVEQVHLLTLDGEEKWLARGEVEASYRYCKEVADAVALGAILRAPGRAERDEIVEKIREFQNQRTSTQPKEASAGCMFKNPDGDSAGRLIDVLGLKETTCGAAAVSGVHGNFVINRGGATSAEVIELMQKVREEVQRRSGILLEPEVQLLGGKWEDFL